MTTKRKWTYYVAWGCGDDRDVEEFDVSASTEREAREKLADELRRDYQPGGRVVRVVERFPGELYF